MLNIETKVKLNNWDATRSQVAMFASFSGNLKQKDSYFMLGNKRLKTREGPNRLGLIYYVRPDALKAKNSHYFLWHLNKVLFLITKSVLSIFLGIKKVVEKERYLYLYKNTRIHIDKVKNLGNFLELETVVKQDGEYSDFRKEHDEVFARLHLETMEKVPVSYSDLKL
ncbi:MAG: hypothetical protein A3I39_02345 [Candidatus Yanofskybacteria bacterium RIFCSPLOWO2_02_FULL_47_9b]|uniref:CYTH domain-containing protein n=1 Tax=Candidatus Yanofskybacteria bacterium RIFCSPLOWO2_02_FULL_47_9b TaxID=1802708 RepID=A0A1F8H5P8_9BACT|nr:MAG: hypothetical protein A3I39_02345 [Candidatus Yanofskybacteria bacterium RIFCSPLOWO2_02_FULL_47_9b]